MRRHIICLNDCMKYFIKLFFIFSVKKKCIKSYAKHKINNVHNVTGNV